MAAKAKTRSHILGRVILSVVIAGFLPFIGPHTGYVPLLSVLPGSSNVSDADPAFYVLFVCFALLYTGIAFALLTLLHWLRSRGST